MILIKRFLVEGVLILQGVVQGQGHFIGHVDFHGVPYEFPLLGLRAAKFVIFRKSHDTEAFTDGERAHANIRNAPFPHGLLEGQHGFRVSWGVLAVIGASGVAACVQVKIILCQQGFMGLSSGYTSPLVLGRIMARMKDAVATE